MALTQQLSHRVQSTSWAALKPNTEPLKCPHQQMVKNYGWSPWAGQTVKLRCRSASNPWQFLNWQSHGEENNGVGSWIADDFGDTEVELIERGDESLNYEQIQSLDPDVILNVRAAFDDQAYERLSEIAPTIQATEGTPDYAVNWRDHTRTIAQGLGKVEEGEAQVAELEEKIADIKDEHPQFDGVELVSGSKFGDAYGASLPGDARFDLYGDLGFVLDADIAELPSPDGFFAAVSVEQVEAMDSDIAVLTTIGYPIEELEHDALINSLDVVKDGRAIIVDPESDIMAGTTAGTVPSLSVALDQVVPELEDVVAKLEN